MLYVFVVQQWKVHGMRNRAASMPIDDWIVASGNNDFDEFDGQNWVKLRHPEAFEARWPLLPHWVSAFASLSPTTLRLPPYPTASLPPYPTA